MVAWNRMIGWKGAEVDILEIEPTEFASIFIMVCGRKRGIQIDSKIFLKIYFFPVLLRYSWHITYKFKV